MIVMVCMSVVVTVLVIHIGYKKTKMPRWVEALFINCLGKVVCIEGPSQSSNNKVNKVNTFFINQEAIELASKNMSSNWEIKGAGGENGAVNGVVNDVVNDAVNGAVNYKTGNVAKYRNGLLREISHDLSVIRSNFEEKAEEDEMQGKWIKVSMIIDRCLLLSFIVFATVVSVGMTTYVIIMSDKEFQTLTEDSAETLSMETV